MKAALCHCIRLLALLYLWTSGTVLWHTHDPIAHDDCGEQHAHKHNQGHHHNEEDCSICFFLHNATAEVPLAQIHFFVFEKPFFTLWNEQINLQYDYLYIRFSPNKDPPIVI